MKKVAITVLVVGLTAMSFKMSIDKTSATVSEIDGVKIFLFSKPNGKYDVSGNVKEALVTADNPEKRIKNLVERAKDKFPSVEGLIITNNLKNAEAIRFKE